MYLSSSSGGGLSIIFGAPSCSEGIGDPKIASNSGLFVVVFVDCLVRIDGVRGGAGMFSLTTLLDFIWPPTSGVVLSTHCVQRAFGSSRARVL